MGINDEAFEKFFKGILDEQKTIKDIAERYKTINVKCPCCEHTIRVKIKV